MDPLQLALEGLLALALGLLLLLEAGALLVQPRRVVPLPRNALAAVQLQDPAGHVVQEVAVVGDGDNGARVPLQVVFQPGHRLGVEVVRGLVQEQDVGPGEEQPAERHAAQLAPREHLHRRVARRAAERVHGHLEAAVQVPGVAGVDLLLDGALLLQQLGHLVVVHGFAQAVADPIELLQKRRRLRDPLGHHLADGLGGIQFRFLFQKADGVARRASGLADEVLLDARHDAQQRAFARAVETDDADLGAVEVRQVDVLEDRALAVVLADADHGVDDLVGFRAHGLDRLPLD